MADNQKKEKKENFFKRAGKSVAKNAKATKSELKKVSWPTGKQLVNNTVIVVVCIVVVGVFIALLDAVFSAGFNLFISREPKQNEIEVPTGVLPSESGVEELTSELSSENASDIAEATDATEATDAE